MASLLVHPATASHGVGTGSFEEHVGALREAGVQIYASGMSSRVRGLDAGTAGAEMAQPQKLVELATAAETTLTS